MRCPHYKTWLETKMSVYVSACVSVSLPLVQMTPAKESFELPMPFNGALLLETYAVMQLSVTRCNALVFVPL